MALYLGIDVGGTTVKGLLADEKGTALCEGAYPTPDSDGDLADCIEMLAENLVRRAGAVFSEVAGIGVGCPGIVDSDSGNVVFAGNLNLNNYPLKQKLSQKFNIPVKVCNDANAAALGEARFGAGKGYTDSVLITLGTGVGGGIIIGGKLFEGYKSAGAEIGHMVIERGGAPCSCGRRGCFEAYCSAKALTEKTKEAMEDNTASEMWRGYTYDTADGRTAFEYMDTDPTAKRVADWYFRYLSCGIINIVNIFRPQVIMMGGGVAAQGSRLTEPLQKLVDKEIFGGTDYAPVKIVCATLGNRAGAYGAVALILDGD